MDEHFKVEVQREPLAALVALSGELDIAAAPMLESELNSVFTEGHGQLVLDLRALEFIDSTGLSVLVKAHQRAQESDVGFGLAGATAQVRRLLDLTGIAERMTVVDDPSQLLGG